MYLNQVEVFVNVVKYKSFSKAAQKLYLSQPTVSSYIKSLEEELGVQLLIRTTKEVELSDAGRIFYEHALELLHTRDVAIMQIQNYKHEVLGTIRIVTSTVPAQYLLPDVLSQISDVHPNLFFSVFQKDSKEAISAINNFEADVGIVGMTDEHSKCTFEPITTDEIVLITPFTPFYESLKGNFSPELFRSEPFIEREDGSGTKKICQQYLESVGIEKKDMRIVAQMQTTESIIRSVHCNLGIAFVSKNVIQDYLKFHYILAFDLNSPLLMRQLYVIYHKNRAISPATEFFITFLKNYCSNILPQKQRKELS